MKQPKFKIGDMVIGGNRSEPFKVHSIFQTKEFISYAEGEGYMGYREDELELYEEPKTRKLYAYVEPGANCQVFFFSTLDSNRDRYCLRAPEYDIEYPKEK